MADTLASISIPSKTWVNLYASSGISVGTALRCQNVGASDLILTVSASEPSDTSAANKFQPFEFFTNETGDSGAWCYSVVDGLVTVSEA